MPTFRTHLTPNPNSIKITTDAGPFIDSGMLSFNTPTEAEGHDLAEQLFRTPGLAGVFIMPDFLTVTKQPAATWDDVLPTVKSILADYFGRAA
ncbi:hypothetical protein AWN76_005220 [Rhodothermaceae bacterium RA]|nr:hypothetical protein AWN76_005220 [Rhodothermaceae bacterium RA]